MIRLLDQYFGGRRAKLPALEAALARILPREASDHRLLSSGDHRELLSKSALMLKTSERALLKQLANRMRLPVFDGLITMDYSLLRSVCSTRQLTFRSLRAVGAVIQTGSVGIERVVCVDPARLALLGLIFAPKDIALARWFDIAGALDRSEQLYLQKDSAAPIVLTPDALLEQLLCILMAEADKHGARELRLELTSGKLSYEFTAADGRQGVGTIAAGAEGALTRVSERQQAFEVLCRSSGRRWLVDSARRGPGIIALTFSEVLRDPAVRMHSEMKAEGRQSGTIADDVLDQKMAGDRDPLWFADRAEIVPMVDLRAQEYRSRPEVLVVEQQDAFALVLKRFLDRNGFAVRRALSVEQALEMIADGLCPALILCDLNVSGLNGVALLKALRVRCQAPIPPVIMLTSQNDVEIEVRLLEEGADAVVAKNEDPRILCVFLKRLLDRARSDKAA